MNTPIMEPEDDTARLRTVIKGLRQNNGLLAAEAARLHRLLVDIVDAGRPHSHLCECDQCLAWEAVRKELRGE